MEGDLEFLRVNPLGMRKWRPRYAVLKGATLHLTYGKGTPDLKTLPLGGVTVALKDITRPADAWRNLFTLTLPPLADRSRGLKKYTFSAVTAELQADWVNALDAASQSPTERRIAAYGRGRRLSRTLSRLAAAAFRPLQLGMGALKPSSDTDPPQEPALPISAADSMQCWALPTSTSTQQFAVTAENSGGSTVANNSAMATVQSTDADEPQPSAVAQQAEFDSRSDAKSDNTSEVCKCRSEDAEAHENGKVEYPKLSQTGHRAATAAAIDRPSASLQPDTTQLIELRMQQWAGSDEQ